MRIVIIVLISLSSLNAYSQSDLDKILKGSELLINGLSFFKKDKSESTLNNSTELVNVCVKNKLSEKIIWELIWKDIDGVEMKKELIIQQDNKECCLALQKGIYSYQIKLLNNEIFRKGEYKFEDDIIITIK